MKWILWLTRSRKFANVLNCFGGTFDYPLKKERLEEVNAELEDSAVWNEPERAQALGREKSSLEAIVETIDNLVTGTDDVEGLVELAVEAEDEETFQEAEAELEDITHVIKTYGEEKFGRRIAHKIIETREHTAITSTKQLADLVDEAVPVKDKHKHPATRTFQAIRIYINSELEEIQTALQAAVEVLKPGGRLVVISFHSLEDRIVKQFIKKQSKGEAIPRGLPLTDAQINKNLTLKAVGKAIKPSKAEIEANPRSRSSVLRVAQRL